MISNLYRVKCTYHKKHIKDKLTGYLFEYGYSQENALDNVKKQFKKKFSDRYVLDNIELSIDPRQKEVIGNNIDFLKVMYFKLKDEMEYDDLLLIGNRVTNLLDKMYEILLELGIDDSFIKRDMD